LRFGLEQAGLERIIAVTHYENHASQAVVRRIGLAFERAITLESLEIRVFSTSHATSPSP